MIHFTVNRVDSLRKGDGINIFLHLSNNQVDLANPWKVLNETGPRVEKLDSCQVASGDASTDACIDIFFDEAAYSAELLTWAFEQLAEKIEGGTRNPAKELFMTPSGVAVYVVFFVRSDREDLMSKRRYYRELRGALERWQTKRADDIQIALSEHSRMLKSTVAATLQIKTSLYCGKCLEETPLQSTPREYARLNVGLTKQGLQIWCTRHEVNVCHVDFEGVNHPMNASIIDESVN